MPDGQHPPAQLAAIADASTIPYRVGLLETAVIGHANRIDALEDWRAELRGMLSLLKAIFGASLIGAITGMLALVVALSGWVK